MFRKETKKITSYVRKHCVGSRSLGAEETSHLYRNGMTGRRQVGRRGPRGLRDERCCSQQRASGKPASNPSSDTWHGPLQVTSLKVKIEFYTMAFLIKHLKMSAGSSVGLLMIYFIE